MKVSILNIDGSLNFEYEVPKGAMGEDLLPSVPYMRSAPPYTSEHEKAYAVNAGTDNEQWVIKPNFAGITYWMPDGSIHICEQSGVALPEGALLSEPDLPPTRQELLDAITVTTQSGKTFDGNETARNNMLSAIMAADIIGQTESQWKLADNTVATVTLTELKEALTLSIQRVGEIVLSN